ncbi:MAG: HD domain-containing phosphohydrolase [Pseudomonadota bacterium]
MSQAQQTQGVPQGDSANPATLLFVDDEANILSSLQRLFRPLGYRILTAGSGAQGLEVMARETVDLVISDMRMPNMDGAAFLEQVEKKWPNATRILLTGYADITSTIQAINKGKIYRYISKPWEDNDLRLVVQHALEAQQLEREKKRLEQVVLKQNEELKALNSNLERRVEARTQEIKQTADMLDLAFQELKRGYNTAIHVFAGMIELRESSNAGHARRVADAARAVAQHLKMTEDEAQDVYYAALLHDIGKIGLPDALINKPFVSLSPEERARFEKHAIVGHAALMALEPLHKASEYIRSHHERFDGKGYPDGLAGKKIPLGARILAAVSDYDDLQLGLLMEGQFSHQEARTFLITNRGGRYDPQVVDAYLRTVDSGLYSIAASDELRLASDDLREGMVTSRAVVGKNGTMLLTKGHVLKDILIKKSRSLNATTVANTPYT